jgi:hypothetical protein
VAHVAAGPGHLPAGGSLVVQVGLVERLPFGELTAELGGGQGVVARGLPELVQALGDRLAPPPRRLEELGLDHPHEVTVASELGGDRGGGRLVGPGLEQGRDGRRDLRGAGPLLDRGDKLRDEHLLDDVRADRHQALIAHG